MRRRLMAAAAMAPLLSLIGLQAANAQVSISSNTSTPVATATASNGSAADVTLAASTTFTINSANTSALTLNSNNSITNSGTITSKNLDGTTGILITGPFTGNVTNAGEINLTEDYTPSDSVNSDGITEAPYAQGSGRIAIRMTGPLTGAITHAGSIDIQGNNSTGISIENKLTGVLVSTGAINMAGDNSFGIHTTGEITGPVQISGAINVKGANSVAIQTEAPIDGALSIYGQVQSTGYASTSRLSTSTQQNNLQATPSDVEQGGSAVRIQSSVLGGVFLAAPPATTDATDTTTDADGDGIVDSAEGTASLITYGSAPTLQIGGPSAITLGNFGTGDNAFGLVIRGSVASQGVFDGVTSTAIDIGGGGGGVNLTGGVHVIGAVSASSFQANATAIHIEAGVAGTQFWNSGAVSAGVTSAGASLATALQIDRGATITGLQNDGTLSAGVTGNAGSATVVVDNSGSLSSVVNRGDIIAGITPAQVGEATTGQGIALDLRANTTGVNLLQEPQAGTTVAPAIVGDVLLGSGVNNVTINSGTLTGALSLGGAAGSSLTLAGASSFKGPLTYTGSSLAVNVPNGNLLITSASTINASVLTFGGPSSLSVALDPINNKSTFFNVSGAATFAAGSKIGATLLSTPSLTGQTFTIVKAGSLSVDPNTTLAVSLPYLFDASIKSSTDTNTIAVTVRTKGPADMAFNKAETSAFNAIYAALPQDTGIQSAIISAPDRATLISSYDQLLPNSSGDVFQTALGMSKAVSRATADRFDTSTMSEDEDEDDYITSGFWASEFYSGVEQNKVDNNAYHSAALGVIGGYDFGGTGVTIAAGSANITRPGQVGDSLNSVSVVEGSFYAAPRFGPLMLDGRIGAGYLKVSDRRELTTTITSGDLSSTSTLTRTADGDWSGYDLTAHLGAGLQWDFGRHLFVQPRVYADVFHVHENAYSERHGGDGFDFDVNQRDSTQTNGTASFITGLKFGKTFIVSPQLELGYDKVMSGGPGVTTARFAYGGPTFSVAANQMDGAAMARFTVRGDGNYVHFSLQAGGEYAKSYHTLDMKAVFRMTF